MSRATLRTPSSICADCSAQDPGWASINRGVLLCDECCSVHRSLGRHISQVRSLRRGQWSSTQLAMVHHLVNSGANNIWEHALIDPSQSKHGRRKPNPRDPVHPTKADYIRAKYQFLTFAYKPKDPEAGGLEDLSKQLNASVRTGNVETSLRLLSLGADPNYFHPEKGNCSLHVAAQTSQQSQVELLIVYGADPGAFDANGKTPVEHAKSEGHKDLVDRLVECQYELTDRLAFYLCGRRPDHRINQHFIIPEMADSSLDLSELAKAAKKKLQALPNHLFEELAMDVYDEVDRRENDAIWLSTQNHTMLVSDRQSVPFLPVNPDFSSTRNQGRQKLARFNAREFATLIIDILSDAKRRQLGIATSPSSGSSTLSMPRERDPLRKVPAHHSGLKKTSSYSDDEPIYDSVASDEDYASIGDNHSLNDSTRVNSKDTISMASSEQSEGSDLPITLEEYLQVKRQLADSHSRIQSVVQANKDLKQEITLLQNMVQKLILENQALRRGESPPEAQQSLPNGHEVVSMRTGNRPQSMFENTEESRKLAAQWHQKQQTVKETIPEDAVMSETTQEVHQKGATASLTSADYENANQARTASGSTRSSSRSDGSQTTPTDIDHTLTDEDCGAVGLSGDAYPEQGEQMALPTQEDVVKKTERITKKIQELLISAQEGKNDSYAVCSEKIHTAVSDMSSLFPQGVHDEKIQAALNLLLSGAVRLREQCGAPPPEINGQKDFRLKTQQVIQCAYDIAKAAKQLVMCFE